MADIKKGIITTIEGNGARVQSILEEKEISKAVKIADYINRNELKKGTLVVYVIFEDMTGIILATI